MPYIILLLVFIYNPDLYPNPITNTIIQQTNYTTNK